MKVALTFLELIMYLGEIAPMEMQARDKAGGWRN